MTPARVLNVVRRLTLVLAGLGLIYLYWRFELLQMPEQGCSPLLRFSPGSPLLVDKQPGGYARGDAAFFLGADGALYLGVVDATPGGGYWLVADNPDCEAKGSDELGVVPEERMQGRILFALSPN